MEIWETGNCYEFLLLIEVFVFQLKDADGCKNGYKEDLERTKGKE